MKYPDTWNRQQPVNEDVLAQENRQYTGTGGVSAGNRAQGFIPAFLDTETGDIYRSRFPNGHPAPVHLLAGLPDELFAGNSKPNGRRVIKCTVISGFILDGTFYSREEAALASGAMKQLH